MTNDPADLEAMLREIEARCEKATKGPWTLSQYTNYRGFGVFGPERGCIAERWYDNDQEPPYGDEIKANANFIAHARTDLPALLRAVRQLQGRVRDQERALEDVKIECLTSCDSAQKILGHIIRLCINAGIKQSFVQLQEKHAAQDAARQSDSLRGEGKGRDEFMSHH